MNRMNILLWVLQALLALAFFAHGCLFLFPPASIADQMNASLPRWFQLFLGVAEVLAAVGLTLPGVTRIHDVHVWPISTTETALTAHLVMPGEHPGDDFLHKSCRDLHDTYGIGHATLQIEKGEGEDCELAPNEVV